MMKDEELIKAFHVMWNGFPEAVMVIKKDREIIAVNKKAAENQFSRFPGKTSSVFHLKNIKKHFR